MRPGFADLVPRRSVAIETGLAHNEREGGHSDSRTSGRGCARHSLLLLAVRSLLVLLLQLLVFVLDLLEVGHVLLVVSAALESDEQFCLLAFALLALDGDCLGLDLLEIGVLVSEE